MLILLNSDLADIKWEHHMVLGNDDGRVWPQRVSDT